MSRQKHDITAGGDKDCEIDILGGNDIILKESIRFRAVKKEQLIQKISCSECDSFQLYQFAETLAVIYMGIVSSLKLKRTQKAAKT